MRSMDPTTVHDDEKEVEREIQTKAWLLCACFFFKKDHLVAFSLYRNPFPNALPEITSGS